jgi:hypothetical protein
MSLQYDTDSQEQPTAEEESQFWAQQLARYLAPYHERLDAYLDRRVVGNLTAAVAAIVQTRTELTTSALGSAICGPAHAEAGTQRLQRALHHEGWEAEVIEEVLWQEAERSRQQMEQQGETPLCIWDSSVLEKPESEKLEGLGAVRSSRVRRLARSRKGLFNQPSRLPVSVRGFEWESLVLLGQSGVPQVVAMTWWSRHKGVPGQQRQQQQVLLRQVAQRWGRQVRHVFDRGSGNGPWLWLLWRYRLRFVVRLSRKATSSSTLRAKSAKPGRWPAANAPGERRGCSGIRIAGSIAARGCSPCRCDSQSIRVNCGWWWCDRARGVSRGICSPMNLSRPSSKPGTSSSPTSVAGKSRKVSVFRNANCSSNLCDCKAGRHGAKCSCW